MSDRLDFSLAQLRYFVAAAETGSISAAAERLHASQSALSLAIQRLERQLGCQLFLRHPARGITLTPAGRRLLSEARIILRQAQDLRAHGRQLQEEVTGVLEVGCLFSVAPLLIPAARKHLAQRCPELVIHVREANSEALHELLRSGICELALVYDLFTPDDLCVTRLVERRPYALVATADPLAAAGRATLAQLATRPLVMLDTRDGDVRRHQEGLFASAGVELPSVLSTTSFETMRGMVAAGLGFCILVQPLGTVETLDGGRTAAVEIVDDIASITLGFATLAGFQRNQRCQAFVDACCEVLSART
ncbi:MULTISPECIES: LysR family transcriptional regulator [unclassified Nocardia]|uniref:LysR family transcriptional regulator n=1 Tax=unclassified Nocardia TaxID=2637762 RepID=UPI001CE4A027|nr:MULTISPECIES: LysR family transcriptional regulator [unclassified Nocardia]